MFGLKVKKENKEEREYKVIIKYKLKESIKTRFKNLGDEDLADDVIEYIDTLLNELNDEIARRIP